MPINLGGYNPHMALGPMGQKIGKAYPNCMTILSQVFSLHLYFTFVILLLHAATRGLVGSLPTRFGHGGLRGWGYQGFVEKQGRFSAGGSKVGEW